MKTLQNNFTTPEQSRKLMELGVPADSADCYYSVADKKNTYIRNTEETSIFSRDGFIPCWSVGRLIEIWKVVTGEKWLRETEQPIIEELISNFNYYSYDNDDPLDFSKLEE